MHAFNGTVDDILSMLGSDPQLDQDPRAEVQNIESVPTFDDFKVYTVQYVQDHDELPENHQTLQQIINSSSVDNVEALLRQNHDYCDDCMLKLFRRYASGNEDQPESCPSEGV